MFLRIFNQLLDEYGQQGWWPISKLNKPIRDNDADFKNYKKVVISGNESDFKKNWPRHLGVIAGNDRQKFEIIIGAILTQNTSWNNVERAIYNLNKNDLIDISKIRKTNQNKLATLIKSSGYNNQKAERLKVVAEFFSKNKDPSRDELLSVKGIGSETADSIILYAFHKPHFVIDAYTRRIFSRIGICDAQMDYSELQKMFMDNLARDTKMYRQYHALIVEHAKKHCKTKPVCKRCPLTKFCKKKF